MSETLRPRHECLCGHDGPTEHARSGECLKCGCSMFDQVSPRLYMCEEQVWPIQCCRCSRCFEDGDEYRRAWIDVDIAELVCVACGELLAPPAETDHE